MNQLQPVPKDTPTNEKIAAVQQRINDGFYDGVPVLLTADRINRIMAAELAEIEYDPSAEVEDQLAETQWREQGEYDQKNQQDRWDGGVL